MKAYLNPSRGGKCQLRDRSSEVSIEAQRILLDGERENQPNIHDHGDHYLFIIVVISDLVHHKIQNYTLVTTHFVNSPHAMK